MSDGTLDEESAHAIMTLFYNAAHTDKDTYRQTNRQINKRTDGQLVIAVLFNENNVCPEIQKMATTLEFQPRLNDEGNTQFVMSCII